MRLFVCLEWLNLICLWRVLIKIATPILEEQEVWTKLILLKPDTNINNIWNKLPLHGEKKCRFEDTSILDCDAVSIVIYLRIFVAACWLRNQYLCSCLSFCAAQSLKMQAASPSETFATIW